jgi:hypothetical protein
VLFFLKTHRPGCPSSCRVRAPAWRYKLRLNHTVRGGWRYNLPPTTQVTDNLARNGTSNPPGCPRLLSSPLLQSDHEPKARETGTNTPDPHHG